MLERWNIINNEKLETYTGPFSEVKVVTGTWPVDQAGEHKFIKMLVYKTVEKKFEEIIEIHREVICDGWIRWNWIRISSSGGIQYQFC
jgi:hypothetical protein